jgi:16S rRNA (uracil1498-N3)-methyltransferase
VAKPGIRLYVAADLAADLAIEIAPDQTHYLGNVMRQSIGGQVAVFNGRDGEWQAEITALGKRGGNLRCSERLQPQKSETDLWLLFAPVKRSRIDQIVEKATELGASVLWPVPTAYTNVERVNLQRLRARTIEASEQCGRLTVPEVRDPMSLAEVLDAWPADRRLLHFDESGRGEAVMTALKPSNDGTCDAILIGPEGGFSASELDGLHKLPFVTSITLGERILRSETAVIAALACWQAQCGDWRE